jgi:precorrin-2 dehydrogenase/sirohydrochlorin ferrochelatase
MYQFFPVNLNLWQRKCLVVGGGRVAERKVNSLLQCGAEIWVVSPSLTKDLTKLTEEGKINYINRNYSSEDVNGCFLVISAVDDKQVNSRVADDCFSRNIPVNVVDDPVRCSFTVPSVLRRGSLCITVSTDGKSPMLAKKIREDLENLFGDEYAEYLEIMGNIRSKILMEINDEDRRRKIFECLASSNILELIKKKEMIDKEIAKCMSL